MIDADYLSRRKALHLYLGAGLLVILIVVLVYLMRHDTAPPAAPADGAGGLPAAGAGGSPAAAAAGRTPATAATRAAPAGNAWVVLQDGLELGVFAFARKSTVGDSAVRIVRIDPAKFHFRLLAASTLSDHAPRTAKEWCQQQGLVAALNAGLFQQDHLTSVAYLRSGKDVINSHRSKDKALMVFDPLRAGLPAVRIADLEAEKFDDLAAAYGSLIQNIRLLSPQGHNVWRQQTKKHSTAAVGMDAQGRILFLHCRSPYSVHDLIDNLLALPLQLKAGMYTEGGPPAQLYLHAGGTELEAVGSYQTGTLENDTNLKAPPIPNVIGISPIAGR